jgi:hypothetical protein
MEQQKFPPTTITSHEKVVGKCKIEEVDDPIVDVGRLVPLLLILPSSSSPTTCPSLFRKSDGQVVDVVAIRPKMYSYKKLREEEDDRLKEVPSKVAGVDLSM